MAQYRLIAIDLLDNANSYVTSNTIRTAAELPIESRHDRTTFPWNQNVAVYWFYHPTFEDYGDFQIYRVECLSRSKIEEYLGGSHD